MSQASFVPGRQLLVTTTAGKGFTMHNLEDSSSAVQSTGAATIYAVATHASTSGTSIVVGASNGWIAVYDAESELLGSAAARPQYETTTVPAEMVNGLCFSEDGDRLFVATKGGPVQVRRSHHWLRT